MTTRSISPGHRAVIGAFLGGGVLLFGGQLHRDRLPGTSLFVPVVP